MGRAVQAFDEQGNVVWQTDYDIYGNLRNLKGDRNFIPFRQLGQIEDEDIELYLNGFRYYDYHAGLYISQDPIGLAGNNPTLYGYVHDSNSRVDVFGLSDCLKKFKKVKIGDEIAPNTTVKRIRKGTNGKAIVIGRGMDDRIIPGAKNIGAEHWTGFDKNLSVKANIANNRKWIEDKIAEGYTVIDVGLDPNPRWRTPSGHMSLKKGVYYGVETEVAFGTRPVLH